MSELLKFMGEHPVLGFFIICSVYYTIYHITYKLPKMFIRHLNIRKAGWPPEHLDADGDFKKEEKEDVVERQV